MKALKRLTALTVAVILAFSSCLLAVAAVEDAPIDPDKLTDLAGPANEDPVFDLDIEVPTCYKPGETITVGITVKNIVIDPGITTVEFSFYYDNTKLVLANDLNEDDENAVLCVTKTPNDNVWENLSRVKHTFDDEEYLATPLNDGKVILALCTVSTSSRNYAKEDGSLAFELLFNVNDDATGDLGFYIDNTSIEGLVNTADNFIYITGNGDTAVLPEHAGSEWVNVEGYPCHDTKQTLSCDACGELIDERTVAPLQDHTPGAEADCVNDQTCTVCGEVLAEALGHTPGAAATCTEDQTCTVCGEVLAEKLGHTPGAEADCTNDQTCTVCGEVLAEKLGHTPGAEADCTNDQTCTVCGEVLNEKLGHTPGAEADCVNDQTCTVCGEVLAEALGHTPGAEADCVNDQTCTV
ncbi:MAG: hypothetical protein IKC39_01775, partial [Clostridia bacterium]|nr:hypothetical protein [Clostridia bacterium]